MKQDQRNEDNTSRSTEPEFVIGREWERRQRIKKMNADGPTPGDGLFAMIMGGGPILGAIVLLGVSLGGGLRPYVIAGVLVAVAWGIIGYVAAKDSGVEGPQAMATGGWCLGALLAVTSGVIALVRAII